MTVGRCLRISGLRKTVHVGFRRRPVEILKGSTSRSAPTTSSACWGPTAPARPRPQGRAGAHAAELGHRRARRPGLSHVGYLPENPYFYDYLSGASSSGSAPVCSASTRTRARPRRGAARRRRPGRGRRHPSAQVLQGHAPAHRHRPGAGQRPAAGAARRAHDRPRPGRAAWRSSASSRGCTSAARRCSSTRTSSATSHELCSRIAIMREGRVVWQGTVAEALRTAPTRSRTSSCRW